jgi:type VI secretion system protein ImpA
LKQLEAPPTEIRRLLKINSIEGKWKNVLELTESAMALPCSRAWLDLQRLTVAACTHLGEQYGAISAAVVSEVNLLLTDLPELRHMTLLDDTPTANHETQAWLDQFHGPAASSESNGTGATAARWNPLSSRATSGAAELIRAGDKSKAIAAMRSEVESQRSGRGRFETRIELIEMLCGPAASPDIAQPLIEQMSEELEQHKLEEWESREFIVRALAVLYRHSAKLAEEEGDRRALFQRICRLDPAQAIALK